MGGNYKSLITNNISKIQRNFNFKIISKVDGCIVLSKSLINNFQNIVEEKKYTLSQMVLMMISLFLIRNLMKN